MYSNGSHKKKWRISILNAVDYLPPITQWKGFLWLMLWRMAPYDEMIVFQTFRMNNWLLARLMDRCKSTYMLRTHSTCTDQENEWVNALINRDSPLFTDKTVCNFHETLTKKGGQSFVDENETIAVEKRTIPTLALRESLLLAELFRCIYDTIRLNGVTAYQIYNT